MNDEIKTRAELIAEVEALRRRVTRLESKNRTRGTSGGGSARPCLLERREAADVPLIFVSIASYADPELPSTLDDCIAKAANPDALRFGICWQRDSRHPVDLSRFREDNRFNFTDFTIEESQGGPWARSLAQRFWNGEPYTLQVDSHMHFEPAWDTKLIAMINELPSENPLITVNSPLFWNDETGRLCKEVAKGVPTTKCAAWNGDWGWAPWIDWGATNTQVPGRTRFLSGNFVFTLGKWNVEVPQDPKHYYWGEEFNLTVRSFTHGYDLFLPREIVAWHRRFVEAPRRHWEHGEDVIQSKNRVAFERLKWLIYSNDEEDGRKLGRYGLGTARSKREYEIYAGFDLKGRRAHPHVYTGENPDPVTIKCEADWAKCLTFEGYKQLLTAVERVRKVSVC